MPGIDRDLFPAYSDRDDLVQAAMSEDDYNEYVDAACAGLDDSDLW